MSVTRQLFWLMVWGVAFAYIEASVVVYLREIYYPDGFAFPVVIAETHMALTEVVRELATLLIMWATVNLTYQMLQSKMAAFMVIFGVWDIFYYIFLKIILNWPEALTSWDILFLIPIPWVGPIWAPIVVSIGLIYAGSTILIQNEEGHFLDFDRKFILLESVAAVIIIVSFLIPGYAVITESIPSNFPYYLFWTGFIMGLGTFLYHYHIHFRR